MELAKGLIEHTVVQSIGPQENTNASRGSPMKKEEADAELVLRTNTG